MTEPVESLTIENVVASTSINQEIDLEVVSRDLGALSEERGTEDTVSYDPEVFAGLVFRINEPNSSMLLFRSGNFTSTGSTSVAAATEAVEYTFQTLQELGIAVPDEPDLTVQNIVTSGDLGEQVNLNAVAVGLGLENIEYEPEQFPGLVYRMPGHDVVTLLFGSGKVVIAGGTSPTDAEEAIDALQTQLSGLGLL